MKKAPSGTTRGVFVVDKAGKVLVAEPGGPAATLGAVKKLMEQGGVNGTDAADEKDDEEPAVEKPAEEAKAENGAVEKKKEEVEEEEEDEKTEEETKE